MKLNSYLYLIKCFLFQKEYNERSAKRGAGEIDEDDYQMYLEVATRDKKGWGAVCRLQRGATPLDEFADCGGCGQPRAC